MQILVPALWTAAFSFAACYPLARWSARLHLIAQPRPDRWHKASTPNTGGIAILIAVASCFLVFAPAGYRVVAACAAVMAIFGFLDDRFEFPPITKFLGQVLAAAVVVAAGTVVPISPWTVVNGALTVCWIVGVTNAFNLIDNMDGLCGGVVLIVSTSSAVLAVLQGDPGRALLLTILGAGSAGFLIHNHKPARIFLGDCGSMFLGFSLATLAVHRGAGEAMWKDSFFALPAFLYPLFDAVLVSVLRRRARKPIWVGGRDHSSHRLVAAGMTERSAVWGLWALTAVCAAFGPLTYFSSLWLLPVLACLIAILIVFGGFLASVPVYPPNIAVPGVRKRYWPAAPVSQELVSSAGKNDTSLTARS
jgi:UDP-GlcNAc:undecaprenyl-phosphate/decaprenyl-phosphate GlcNAc-1-phosphate transferase